MSGQVNGNFYQTLGKVFFDGCLYTPFTPQIIQGRDRMNGISKRHGSGMSFVKTVDVLNFGTTLTPDFHSMEG
jgi:hypothetical protein